MSFDYEAAPLELQMELIDLQSKSVLKDKFNSVKKFFASLNETKFSNIRQLAQKMLVLFGSTYVCEQMFSVMKINKTRHRAQLTDEHLRAVLRISTTEMEPDFDVLTKKGAQQHCSH